MSDWKSRATPVTSQGSWKSRATPVDKIESTQAADASDSFGVKALDAIGTQMQLASDTVVAGVDSIPGMGYVKKGLAAIAAPIKGESYEDTVGGYNKDIEERWERSPVNALAGSVLFGSKLPGVGGANPLSRIAGNTSVAAVDSLGRGEAGLNTKEAAKSSMVNAGVSVATELPGIAGKVVKAGKGVVDKAKSTVPHYDAIAGAYEKGAQGNGVIGHTITGPFKAAKELLSTIGETTEQRKIADTFRKHLGPGHSQDMNDADVIAKMVDEGNEQAIKFVANAQAFHTGAPDEHFEALLRAGPTARRNARDFDFDKAGGELAPELDNVASVLRTAAGKRTGDLNEAARSNYLMVNAPPTEAIETLRGLVAKGREHQGTVGNVSYINAAHEILESGSSTIPGLSKGSWEQITDVEMYDRLQHARSLLGENIAFSKAQSLPKAAQESQNAYHAIGKVLKFDPDKMEGDDVWSSYKKLEKNLLHNLDVDGEVNKYKVGGALKDTQSAKIFRDKLELLDEFAARPGLSPDVAETVKAFRDRFAKNLDVAELRRNLQSFEKGIHGVSGKTGAREASAARGDNQLAEMIRSPVSAMEKTDRVIGGAEKVFGKSFKEMSAAEKTQIAKFRVMVKKNPNLSFVEFIRGWQDSGVPGSGFKGGSTLNDLGDFAAQRAVKYGADQAYNAVTGDEEGVPDPLKEKATQYLKEKYNLTDDEVKWVKRIMPGLYDMAGMVKGKTTANIWKNDIRPGQLLDHKYQPGGKKISERNLLNGTTHMIYKDGADFEHFLVKDGQRVARIQGNIKQGAEGKPVFVVNVSSAEGGHGYGKQLYDATLDTHGTMASGTSLSPEGSHKVWTQYIAKHPEVEFTSGTWGTDDRHIATLKDKEGFRSKVAEQGVGLDEYWMERASWNFKTTNHRLDKIPDETTPQKVIDANTRDLLDPNGSYFTLQASRRVPTSFFDGIVPKLTYDNRGEALNKLFDTLNLTPKERQKLVNSLMDDSSRVQERATDEISTLLANLQHPR